MSSRRGLTLLELLVGVAIVLVLAGIALVNYQHATTRSRTARVVADMNVLRGAVEAYNADRNGVPRMTWGRAPFHDRYTGMGATDEPISATLGPWLTTPVAYASAFDIPDPFARGFERVDGRIYTYQTQREVALLEEHFNERPVDYDPFAHLFERYFGAYFLWSVGPDELAADGNGTYLVEYDPTNGTMSAGNIIFSQKKAPAY